jgi:hypothetical protein
MSEYEWRQHVAVLLRANARLRAIADAQAELKVAILNELRKSDPTNSFLDKHYRNRFMLAAYRRALVDVEVDKQVL